MLAQKYDESKVIFPAYIQKKYDGIRCRAVIKDGVVSLWTRDNKPIVSMDHIIQALSNIKEDCELDGELYVHDIPFQSLNGIIRRQYHNEESLQVQYIIYDIIDDSVYSHRFQQFSALLDKYVLQNNPPIRVIDLQVARSHDEVLTWHNRFVSEGYEGAMVRTNIYDKKSKKVVEVGYEAQARNGKRRSWSLMKFKQFDDDEFKIIGFEEEHDIHNKPKARVGAFILQLSSGESFRASGISDQIKDDAWANPSSYLNKYATIRYFGTSEKGIPRFPNFVDIRWDK